MNNNKEIKSYKELLLEKERLMSSFKTQRDSIKENLAGLKTDLNPVNMVMRKFGDFLTPDKSLGLLNVGITFGLDVLLRKLLLKKSGWWLRLLVPFLVKNKLSNFVAEVLKDEMPGLKNMLEKRQDHVVA